MNQTKKRLSIIKLAISITDLETIQLQILKLLPLQADTQLQEILSLLQTDNYAQAQSLITLYIETASEEVVQRTPATPLQESTPVNTNTQRETLDPGLISAEDQAIIDEFQLFVTNAPEPSKKNEEVDINDFLSYVPEESMEEDPVAEASVQEETMQEESIKEESPAHSETEANSEDPSDEPFEEETPEEETIAQVNLQEEDTTLSSSQTSSEAFEPDETASVTTNSIDDSFFSPVEDPSSLRTDTINENEDDFFSLESENTLFHEDEEKMFKEKKVVADDENPAMTQEEINLHSEMDTDTQALFSSIQEEEESKEGLDEVLEEHPETDQETTQDEPVDSTLLIYEAMPHISLKLIDMKKRYPAIQKTYEKFEEVESLTQRIANEGYTEEEIQAVLESTKILIGNAQYTQAAQLLLVCAATESKFAQFMLARELYIGSVLSKNISESFALMSALAIEDYPEALCDLGQFYENGIATTVDKARAKELYQGAVNAGIKRATKHYSRLAKSKRGLFKS